MLVKGLSYSQVDYIEAIAHLTHTHGHAHTKDIADTMKVKMPSVTIALQQLAARGYINYSSHRPVELTESGKVVAAHIEASHRALEHFFQMVLALPPDTAHIASSSIDHIVDDDVVRRFVAFSNAIAYRSDSHALAVHLSEAMAYINDFPEERYAVLSALNPGVVCEFVRPSRNFTGIAPFEAGQQLEIGEFSLDRTSLAVFSRQDNKRTMLAREDAENLWVRVLSSDDDMPAMRNED
jgi:DtxR family transcriptional regulator, Mn-dependent transcriptional regulator